MKIIYTFLALLICNSIVAQISVRNSAYVFVDNEVVFVNDDVNIEESTANIYLRNEAQLVQGTGITGNSGFGKLSVYQNGTTNNFAYNYWCSPVGNIDTNDNNNRAFRANNQIYDFVGNVDPMLNPITSNQAIFISGYDSTSSPLNIARRWIYSYSPGTEYSEWDYETETGEVGSAYGFIMKGTSGSGNNQLYDFRGKPNSGTINTNVLNGQQTLVGNPYPSALDAADYIWDTVNQVNITGTLYFWEQDLAAASSHYVEDYVGGYASYTITDPSLPGVPMETFIPATFDSYNSDGSLNTSGSITTSGKAVKRYIAIGQGFMIEGTSNLAARATNLMRDYVQKGSQSEFFRTGQNQRITNENTINYNEDGLQIIPEEYKRFRINIDFNEQYTRQLVQNFHYSATDGFDYGLESKSSEPMATDAVWIFNDDAYAAQAFVFNEDLRIPLIVNIENQQLVRFRIFDIQNFDDSQSIYIHDIENELYVDLRVQNYEITLETGNYNSRFEIVFRSESLSTDEYTLSDLEIFQNNSASELTILNPKNLEIKNVSLYDVGGKQVFIERDLTPQNKHTFSTKNLSDGVYVAKITLADRKGMNKKVIISNKN